MAGGKKMFSTVAHTQATADEALPNTSDVQVSRRPEPKTSEERIAYTWRLTPDEADQLDMLTLNLRRQLGRRRLDKASVLLALVQLADERQDLRLALVHQLDSPPR